VIARQRPAAWWLWSVLCFAALLWPSRFSGPLDGAPLDGPVEAIGLGLLLPILWWFHPEFLVRPGARQLIAVLIVVKAATGVLVSQDGLCLRLTTPEALVLDGPLVQQSWDIRTDWPAFEPRCSAVMTRDYATLFDFPMWFFNLPPRTYDLPLDSGRPPTTTISMNISGFLTTNTAGTFRLDVGPGMTFGARDADTVRLAAGVHRLEIPVTLTGDRWRLRSSWNDTSIWTLRRDVITTLTAPSTLDVMVRPWAGAAITLLVALVLTGWTLSAVWRIGHAPALAWIVFASAVLVASAASGNTAVMRAATLVLFGALFLRVPRRLQNTSGAFAIVGVPWVVFFAAIGLDQIGRFTLYTPGDDWWQFQRYAYWIFMRGHWLEGGQPTFWFQPLYRWIAGSLHLVFGDSSVGELYWDVLLLVAGALLAFRLVKCRAGFAWGIAAAAATLTVATIGPGWYLIGRGLAEISSAGLIALSVFFVLRGRNGDWRAIVAAGMFALLAFYTRLNNLGMALAVIAFLVPLRISVEEMYSRHALILRWSQWAMAAAVVGIVGGGLLLFALRTWRYTGVFSVFYGTQRYSLATTQPSDTWLQALRHIGQSLLMVMTMSDPSRAEPRATFLVLGSLLAVAGALYLPWFRAQSFALVAFCLAGLSGSAVARGTAYPGRFSLHLVPITIAIVTSAAARLYRPSRAAGVS